MNAISQWSCQRCTLLNEPNATKCNACDFVNPHPRKKETKFFQKLSSILTNPLEKLDLISSQISSPRASFNVTADWCCPNCAQINLANLRWCHHCNFDRNYDAKYLSWICERCGLKQPIAPFNLKCPLCNVKTISKRGLSVSMPQLNNLPITQTLPSSSFSPLSNDVINGNSKLYNEIFEFCRSNQQTFVDDGFSHSNRSIGLLDLLEKKNLSIVWLRPHQIVTRDGRSCRWSVFNDPQPVDIEQGALGNCWFLSALAVVAERPDILEQIVITKEYSHHGVYEIRLCVDGVWQSVVIDDFFPCAKKTRTMVFAVGRKNQLWVSLIEKALAKIYGNYTSLRAGRTVEGLATLTGAPSQTIDLEIEENVGTTEYHIALDLIWAKLLSAREASFLMGCSCGAGKRSVNETEYHRVGLMPRHAYSILEVRQLDSCRLLRVRNPWGTFVWLGEWSVGWPGWTQELRRQLSISEKTGFEPGTFWIPFDRFVQYFDSVDIAEIRDCRWTDVRYLLDVGWSDDEATKCRCVRATITESTEVCVTVFQRNARTILDQVDIIVLIHREDPNCCGAPGELVACSSRKIQGSIRTNDVFLLPGDYIIQVISFSKFAESKTIPATIVIYSAKKVFTEMLSSSMEFMQRSFISLILRKGTIEQSLDGCVIRYLTNDFAGLALMVDNLSEHHCAQVNSDCQDSMNVLSSRCSLYASDSIPPLHRQIITVLTHFEPSQPYTVGHRLAHRLTSFPQLRDFAPQLPNTQNFPPLLKPAMIALHAPKPLYM